MSKKGLKFVLYEESNSVLLNPSLMLLVAKIDLILKKQSRKKDMLIAHDTGYIKMIFALLIKIITLYTQAFII